MADRHNINHNPSNEEEQTLLSSLSFNSLQTLEAAIVIEEFLRLGIKTFIISPGARSIPLILALNNISHNENLSKYKPNVILVNDERSAAFMAQGLSKSGEIPCLICTSGTAVANYLPGVIEAYYSKAPIVVVTADRPWELLSAGANQTIHQKDIFNDFIAFKLDLPAPESKLSPHSLLSNIGQLCHIAQEQSLPVHLNIAFRKPFYDDNFEPYRDLPKEEISALHSWYESSNPYSRRITINKENPTQNPKLVQLVEQELNINTDKPLIIAGPIREQFLINNLVDVSKSKKIPIIADIHSNLRQHNSANIFCLFNLYLDQVSQNALPSVAYHIGDRLISDEVHKFLTNNKIPLIRVSDHALRSDAIENEFFYPKASLTTSDFLNLIRSQSYLRFEVIDEFKKLEQQVRSKVELTFLNEGFSERSIITSAISYAPENSNIFLSASLTFREADSFSHIFSPKVTFFGNRGATGIDGIISSALGSVLANSKPLLCILGDQAAFHDLTSLSLVKNLKSPAVFLIINNGGGAIFNIMKKPELRDTLINPHAYDFKGFAESFMLNYFNPLTIEDLKQNLKSVYGGQKSAVIEVRTDGVQSVKKFKNV